MVRVLHLRLVVGAAIALSVAAVAAVTLAVSLTIALDTIRSNADSSVARLGHSTAETADSVFATPEKHLSMLHDAPQHTQHLGMLPTDHPDFTIARGSPVLDAFTRLVLTLEVETQFSYLALYSFFVDGSMTWCQSNPFSGGCEAIWPNSSTTQGPSVITAHNKADGIENTTLTAQYRATGFTSEMRDLRNPATKGAFAYFNAIGQRKTPTSKVAWIAKSFAIVGGVSFYALTSTAAIRNATHLLGHSFGVIEIRTVNAVLTRGLLTSNSRVVLFDNDGYLFAASTGVDVLDINPTYNTTGRPKCFSADSWSDVPATACQIALTHSNDKTVRSVALEDASLFASPQAKGAVKHVAKAFVFVETLPTLPGALRLSLALFVPEDDIVGDADKILPVCAGAAAGVVVVAAVLIIGLLTVILRPLETIALKMVKTARFEKDDDAVNISVFAEIGDLQRAFVEMRNELDRIRAFVPQSLLRAAESTEDEELTVDGYSESSGHDDDNDGSSAEESGRSSERSHTGRPRRTLHSPEGDLPSLCSSNSMSRGSPRPSVATHGNGNADGNGAEASPTPGPAMRKQSHANSVVSSIGRASPHHVHRRGLAAGGMRFDKVSVLFLNLRGFNNATAASLNMTSVSNLVDVVLGAVNAEKGVVDSFHGDRFMVSFNAVKPAASHGNRASTVAARVIKSLKAGEGKHFGLGVTCGVATGRAQVGNAGSDMMKRFSIVGPVVSQAACLERLCKLYPQVSCLVPQRMFEDLQTAVSLQTVDFVQLPFAKAPCLVGSVDGELQRAVEDDEWMYQLQDADSNNEDGNPGGVSELNAAWRFVAQNRAAEIPSQTVRLCSNDASGVVPSPAWQRLGAAVKRSAAEGNAARPLGDFYDECVC